MKVILNHFNNKTTLILHNRIINGCQDFHVNDADAVRRMYDVPQKMMDECVAMARIENDGNMGDFVEHDGMKVRCAVAKHGLKEHLDVLVADPDLDVRCAVAKRGLKEHLDVLVADPHWEIRYAVANHGLKEHLDVLVADPYWDVRLAAFESKEKQNESNT